jgi:hypothetical protein
VAQPRCRVGPHPLSPGPLSHPRSLHLPSGATFSGFELKRYTTAGALDTTFNDTAIVTTVIGSAQASTYGIAIYPGTDTTGNAGTNVAVGTTGVINGKFAITCYPPSAPQVGSFAAIPNPQVAGGSVTLTASGITDGNPNSTVTRVAFYRDSNGDGLLGAADTLPKYGTNAGGVVANVLHLRMVGRVLRRLCPGD